MQGLARVVPIGGVKQRLGVCSVSECQLVTLSVGIENIVALTKQFSGLKLPGVSAIVHRCHPSM